MTRLTTFLFLIITLSFPVSAQTQSENFAPLDSSLELGISDGKVALEISSKVIFIDHLVSDEVWSKMGEEEKKSGYASVYYYKYTFTNTGTRKVRFTFANYDALHSPLFQFIQDFSIVLEPGQSKTINFTANTAPKGINTGIIIMAWFPEKGKWFRVGGSSSSLYIPEWNAIAEETAY